MTGPLLLGIDVGTGGAKAILIDAMGNVRANVTTEYPLSTPRPQWSEQDPDDWWNGTYTSIRAAMHEAGVDASAIAAVGLTGQMHGLVLIDDAGAPLQPAILWNDQRTGAECEEIHRRVGRERVIAIHLHRLTRWFHVSREWIKKAVLMDDLYVFNNPWSLQSMEKHTSYCAMLQLGMPVPPTMLIPPKEYDVQPDLQVTLERYARLFDLAEVGDRVGYPLFMKPYDGGGWVGVSKIENLDELKTAYEESGRSVMHAQKGLVPYDAFVRCIGVGPQTQLVDYDPGAPHHERYGDELDLVAAGTISEEDAQLIRDTTLTINTFFGWDFNSCELIKKDGVWHPFDFANPCPDAQVTSLHVHFPWIVLSQIRWSLFCAATQRAMPRNLDWTPFYAIAARDVPYAEKLAAYTEIANQRLDTERFEAFCDTHLSHLDEVARKFFGSEKAHAAVRKKVEAIFPEHEWDEFTEHFWSKIQNWRQVTV